MMMKKTLLSLVGVALFTMACDRDTDTLGPDLNDIYGEFQMLEDLTLSRNQVDFSSNEQVVFNARFSKTVDWELHVIGDVSGARKLMAGKSKLVDASNATWIGNTTDLPMFKQENCQVVLSVPEEGYADSTQGLEVTGTKVNDGFVVADFENGVNPGWTIFAQSGGDMSFNIVQDDQSPEEYHFFDMGGQVDFDYLIGLMDFPAAAYGETHFPLSSIPDNVYFNVFLKAPAGINNEIVLFRFFEDENGNGSHEEQTEDMYALELTNLDTSWATTTIRYSDLTALVNGQPATPNGNGIHEPDKIMQVSVLFLADPSSGYSQTLMDYMVFTENDSIQP